MPPKRAAQSDEEKKKIFDDWLDGPDYKAIQDLQKEIEKDPEIAKIDRGTEDIYQDWSQVCAHWYKLVETLKVPKKSKGKLFIAYFSLINVWLFFSIRITHPKNYVLPKKRRP